MQFCSVQLTVIAVRYLAEDGLKYVVVVVVVVQKCVNKSHFCCSDEQNLFKDRILFLIFKYFINL